MWKFNSLQAPLGGQVWMYTVAVNSPKKDWITWESAKETNYNHV